MSKAIYLGGANGTALNVKNLYIGVDGVAQKVMKGYVGVDGIARLFYSSINKHTITIVQSENQVITVHYNGVDYTDSFEAVEGDTWTAAIVSTNDVYIHGTLNATSGIVTENITISATDASVASVAYWLVVDRDKITEVNDDNLL